jgi:hypothetical protein
MDSRVSWVLLSAQFGFDLFQIVSPVGFSSAFTQCVVEVQYPQAR